MRLDVPTLGDDLQCSILGSIYFGRDTACDVVAVLVGTDSDTWLSVVFISTI